MSNKLVVRHRYSVAQALAEILRDDDDDDDDNGVDNFIEDNADSEANNGMESESDEIDSVENAIEVPDEIDEDDVTEPDMEMTSDAESDTTVDYEYEMRSDIEDTDDDDQQGDDPNDDVIWSRCKTIPWKRHPRARARQPARNVLTQDTGIPSGLVIGSVIDSFRNFVDDPFLDHILFHTNLHAREIKLTSPSFRWENDLQKSEFLAFIGLLILAGVQKCKSQNLPELWDLQWGLPVFRATMSYRRFTDILRALRFDDKSTRQQRITETGNQGAAVHDIMELFVSKCRSSFNCGSSVTIDEQLISFHGKCRFRMYIPSKPGKYGLKMWIMADSETFYCSDAQLYCGKIGNQADVGQGMRVVLQLSEHIRGSGRNVTMDNFFTSYALARELSNRRLTLVGTVRSNRREVPIDMLPNAGREVYSSLFGFSPDGMTLVSYVPKKERLLFYYHLSTVKRAWMMESRRNRK